MLIRMAQCSCAVIADRTGEGMLSLLLTTIADASVVNGGAIDAFVHVLRPEHILGLLLTGMVCAQFATRLALRLLLLATGGLLAGAALTAASLALPLASLGWVIALGVLVLCALFAARAPAWLAGVAMLVFTILVVNSHALELQTRGMNYMLSFIATFTFSGIGLVWMGLALAFIAGRSRAGKVAVQVAGLTAVVLGVAAWLGSA